MMAYYARIRLEDYDSDDVYKVEGNAEKVLCQSVLYIKKKDGDKKLIQKVIKYLKDDFIEFESMLKGKDGRE